MPKKRNPIYDRLIDIGLQDPFIRTIVGLVVIAVAASFAVSALGSGTKAVITLALALSFGVVLLILRTLMKYVDSAFVRMVCFVSSGVIMFVFLVFALLLIPAAVICWPQPYAQLLSLPNCAAAAIQQTRSTQETVFVPTVFPNIAVDPANSKYLVFVFYRPERLDDAQRIVGALLSAGYRTESAQSSLNEVITPNRQPNTTLIKTTASARPAVDDVLKFVKIAIPVKAASVILFPDDATFQRGNFQIDLF